LVTQKAGTLMRVASENLLEQGCPWNSHVTGNEHSPQHYFQTGIDHSIGLSPANHFATPIFTNVSSCDSLIIIAEETNRDDVFVLSGIVVGLMGLGTSVEQYK
jgi:hypothetical protein